MALHRSLVAAVLLAEKQQCYLEGQAGDQEASLLVKICCVPPHPVGMAPSRGPHPFFPQARNRARDSPECVRH